MKNCGNFVTRHGRSVHRKVTTAPFGTYACGMLVIKAEDIKTRAAVSCKRCLAAIKRNSK